MLIAGLSRREGRTQGCPKPHVGTTAEDFCPRIGLDWVGVDMLAQVVLTTCPCTLPDPCQNHHCKHGKVCELDENNSPMCVCQDPTSCPAPIGEFEKVRTEGQRQVAGGLGSSEHRVSAQETGGLAVERGSSTLRSPLTRSDHEKKVEMSQGGLCLSRDLSSNQQEFT